MNTTNTYFTSDPHYWHTNVIAYCDRPYASVEEMNEVLVGNWNEVVGPEDTVYCLGDFSLAFRAVELLSSRLNGKKYLVPGNHDFCHSYHKKSRKPENRAKWIDKYTEHGWTVTPEQITITIPGVGPVDMCHHPYDTPYTAGDKYAKWRPVDNGRVLLCGHIHEKWKLNRSPGGTLMINVGVDQWDYRPVHADEIVNLVNKYGNGEIANEYY